MTKTIKYFQSPTFQNETRQIIILEPAKITATTPVLFFFDGQILKLGAPEFNQTNGIAVFDWLKPHGPFVIMAVNSMRHNGIRKYKRRARELLNCDRTGNYLFFNIVKLAINELKQKYQGEWTGFGYSLSGFLIGAHEQLFDKSVLVSPALKTSRLRLPGKTYIFYGEKEYRFFSTRKVNGPVRQLAGRNPGARIIKLKTMKHTFSSWNKHFGLILKTIID